MSKSVGNIALAARGRSSAGGRDALVMYFADGPLPPAARASREETLEEAARAASRGSARPRGAWSRGASPEDLRRVARALLRRARRRLQHPAALAALFEWVRGGQPARRRAGDAGACARCSTCSGSRRCSSRRGADAPDQEALALLAAREAARAARDFAAADRLRDELRGARLGGPRPADGPGLVPPRDRLRPQPGARGAARAAPARPRGLGDRAAPRASRGWREPGVPVHVVTTAEHRQRSRRDGAPGRLRATPTATRTPTRRELLARPDAADRRARRGPGPAEPRRDLPDGRVRRARPAS